MVQILKAIQDKKRSDSGTDLKPGKQKIADKPKHFEELKIKGLEQKLGCNSLVARRITLIVLTIKIISEKRK